MPEVRFELNINRVVGEATDHGNVDTAAFLEPLDRWPEKRPVHVIERTAVSQRKQW